MFAQSPVMLITITKIGLCTITSSVSVGNPQIMSVAILTPGTLRNMKQVRTQQEKFMFLFLRP